MTFPRPERLGSPASPHSSNKNNSKTDSITFSRPERLASPANSMSSNASSSGKDSPKLTRHETKASPALSSSNSGMQSPKYREQESPACTSHKVIKDQSVPSRPSPRVTNSQENQNALLSAISCYSYSPEEAIDRKPSMKTVPDVRPTSHREYREPTPPKTFGETPLKSEKGSETTSSEGKKSPFPTPDAIKVKPLPSKWIVKDFVP